MAKLLIRTQNLKNTIHQDPTSMKKYVALLLAFTAGLATGYAQDIRSVYEQLYSNHAQFEEMSLENRRFRHEHIEPLINRLRDDGHFTVRRAGQSIEGRSIYLVTVGTGDTNILFWSQMHGNEPTATAAIFDVINFLRNPGDNLDDFRDRILKNATLHFLPMLNPDGAEQFRRRNAIDIDINRDARRLTSPESIILKQVRDSLEPAFGFNLHDQSVYYAAGRNEKPAAISFLAPAYDYEQSVNDVRANAMKLIVQLNSILQHFIPGQVAKYSDAHEPRAFGDMIQKWGTSTVLIESGGYKNDPEKEYLRTLNFLLLLAASDAVGRHTYRAKALDTYYAIPQNESSFHDLVIRNVNIERDGTFYKVDLAIRHNELNDDANRSYRYRSRIADIGDLSVNHGYRELDGKGLTARPGSIYGEPLSHPEEIAPRELLNRGYTGIVLNGKTAEPEKVRAKYRSFPLNLILSGSPDHEIRLGAVPNLVLTDDEGQIRYVIVNGFVYDTREGDLSAIQNGLVYE